MKFATKILEVLMAFAIGILIFFGAATLAVAQPSKVWIDDDYCNGCPNDGHAWGYDAFDRIQDGIDAVASPGTVYAAAGIFEEKVVLKTQVSLLGAGIELSTIDGLGLEEGELVTMATGSKLSDFSVINSGGIGVFCSHISAFIEGNFIAHHEEIGIALEGSGSQNTIIRNNIVTDTASYGGIFGNTVVGSPQIINNTVVGNNSNGIGFWYRGTPIIKNNIIVNNKGSGIVVGGNETYGIAEPVNSHNNSWNNSINWNNCEPGEGAMSENPLFVNESGGDYHLLNGSPCIDAGTSDNAPDTDFERHPRPQGSGYDIGADEFVICNGEQPTIVGTEGPDVINGTEGPDVIHGLGGVDLIRGLGGDDVICGGDGSDVIGAGSGNDIILGENGHDVIWGGPGNDVLRGGDGNDSIFGGPGNDEVWGNFGNDSLYGKSGADKLFGGWGPVNGTIDNNDTCYDVRWTHNWGCEVFYED